jgi:hydrogenase maturation factor
MSKDSSKRTPAKTFKRGDRVTWNSEAGHVTGIVQKKITSEVEFKGYRRHASKDEPQYIIKSEKTDHIAIHKGSALKKIPKKQAGPSRTNRG